MSAIPCASVSLKTMADGTLRISFDVEPVHAQDAFRLFAAPGTPAALAALKVGYATVDDYSLKSAESESNPLIGNDKTTSTNDKPKGGALAKLAGMWCNDPEFWAWLEIDDMNAAHSPQGAALCLYDICEISSRAELDNNPAAAEKFHQLIRGPYSKHLIARGITA